LQVLLAQAEAAGHVQGEVVLVPVANPIGLSQRLDRQALGRFELGSGDNFNRHYPVLANAVFDAVRPHLGADAQLNTALVHRAVATFLSNWAPSSELDSLRRQLLLLAHDADVVIDLHCDAESVLHLYSEDACWPALEPLARLLGCQAVLLARDSGGSPFDECLSGLWWQLADKLQAAGVSCPLPQACAATTVELRGQADVQHALAQADAQALMAYLQHLGAVNNGVAAADLPALPCHATPLAGSETLRSPGPGVLVFLAPLGSRLQAGDVVAEVINPISGQVTPVATQVHGVFYARVTSRFVHTGEEIGKVAGERPFRTGPLLGF
jgi:predicted deacylase